MPDFCDDAKVHHIILLLLVSRDAMDVAWQCQLEARNQEATEGGVHQTPRIYMWFYANVVWTVVMRL